MTMKKYSYFNRLSPAMPVHKPVDKPVDMTVDKCSAAKNGGLTTRYAQGFAQRVIEQGKT
jgi:hypothetical protein